MARRGAQVRYVGNRGHNLWRTYNLNETNIIENGFLQEFRNAQRNLAINLANGRTGFANQGLAGQVPLPIFETAFGPRGSMPAVPAASGFTNGTFVDQLQQGQAGRLANTLAGDFRYLCPMVGSGLPGCASRGYNAPGPYPINVFQANPFAAGSDVRLMTDESTSEYDALQMQFRQRYARASALTANYTFGKARTDRYLVVAPTTPGLEYASGQVAQLGADGVRPAAQLPGLLRRTNCPLAKDGSSRSTTRCSTRLSAAGRHPAVVRMQTGGRSCSPAAARRSISRTPASS